MPAFEPERFCGLGSSAPWLSPSLFYLFPGKSLWKSLGRICFAEPSVPSLQEGLL